MKCIVLGMGVVHGVGAQEGIPGQGIGPQGVSWVENDFPFFSSVLEMRDASNPNHLNRTPRGIVIPVNPYAKKGEIKNWIGWDVDLMRLAGIWEGTSPEGVSLDSMSRGSFVKFGWKSIPGQTALPKPDGEIWLENGTYPGWQVKGDAQAITWSDPRASAPTQEEVGRGALPPSTWSFKSVEPLKNGVRFSMEIGEASVEQTFLHAPLEDHEVIRVHFKLGSRKADLVHALGNLKAGLEWKAQPMGDLGTFLEWKHANKDERAMGVPSLSLAIQKGQEILSFLLNIEKKGHVVHVSIEASQDFENEFQTRWAETVETKLKKQKPFQANGATGGSFVMESIELPSDNPWKRIVRLSDVAIYSKETGRSEEAVGVTFDGDLWKISGLGGSLDQVRWKRFASGLHEPMGVCVRGEEIFVFDRNGLWKVVDQNGDGEADLHQMHCHLFSQTSESREFSSCLKLAPDGSFLLSKGGQQSASHGKHNGTVIRISPDGLSMEVLAEGLRQPFLGVHPITGMITASDQQGEFIPTTPLHVIEGQSFYGYEPPTLPLRREKDPVAVPMTWIPHPVNPSAITQVWGIEGKEVTGRLGPLSGELIHLGYNRPEIFRVLMNPRFSSPRQAAVMSVSRDLDFAPLNGVVNPWDGALYVTGFQVFGTTAPEVSGLARLRFVEKSGSRLLECTPVDRGILLRFDQAIDFEHVNARDLVAERWNYQRTRKYGSPHLKLNGEVGQEELRVRAVQGSKDGKSILLELSDMQPVMQMSVKWSLKLKSGEVTQDQIWFSPHELLKFLPEHEGFETSGVRLTFDESELKSLEMDQMGSLEEGKQLAFTIGCMACHSVDGNDAGKVGPGWLGLFGSERLLKDGVTKVNADVAYLKESILNPGAKVVKGYDRQDAGMPIYAGVLNERQINSLLLYIQSLGKAEEVSSE